MDEGDLVYIDALDRLGRDYDGIIREWKEITRELRADIVCLDNKELFDSRKFKIMDTADSCLGKLLEDQFLSLLGYVADQERKKILKRQEEGIKLALSQGKPYGRPKTVVLNDDFIREYKRWKAGEVTATRAMDILNMSRAGFYRLVKEYEASKVPIE